MAKFRSGDRVMLGTNEWEVGTVLDVHPDTGQVQVHWDNPAITWHHADDLNPFCDVCDEPIDLSKDKYARNEIPTCIPYCPELEGWTCENCRERAYDRHVESFYG